MYVDIRKSYHLKAVDVPYQFLLISVKLDHPYVCTLNLLIENIICVACKLSYIVCSIQTLTQRTYGVPNYQINV